MTTSPFDSRAIRSIRRALLAFFDASARDLPWRRSGDPYAIWISEVMAQQTRLDTVIPYWERWLQRFPDVGALADAPLDDVLKEWEGLGYYSRARNLHAAARLIAERHGGALPGHYEALRALPGIGDYTAGAVSSIAFGVRAPVVDGNVRRVLARLLDDPAPAPRRLREVAASLVPGERPGDFNQALMELGSLVCTPRSPQCDSCPVAAHCAARAAGTQLDRPCTERKQPTPAYDVATVIIRARDGTVLITRRPGTGLLAGLWGFPGRELQPGEAAAPAAAGLATALLPGVELGEPRRIGSIRHAFSHRREIYDCHVVEARGDEPEGGRTSAPSKRPMEGAQRAMPAAARALPAADRAWIGAERGGLTLPRAQQKIHALVFARSVT
jgi:A/G-specific adenine glycosylase